MDKCFMVPAAKEPEIVLAYIHVSRKIESEMFAKHFVDTYKECNAGYPHKVVVICNGSSPIKESYKLFSEAGFDQIIRSNDGWDIGGYLDLSTRIDPDLILCLGESVYFHRSGWMERISEAWSKHGEGMYGLLSSLSVRPHLNTTAFACSPQFLREHPPVTTKQQRYDFEHGISPLWSRLEMDGYPTKLVTWDGEYDRQDWRTPKNIMWRGDQSNCLVFCNHTDKYFGSDDFCKRNWGRMADGLKAIPKPNRSLEFR